MRLEARKYLHDIQQAAMLLGKPAIADGHGFLLIENHCPICRAAVACTGLCRQELEVFRAALGRGIVIKRTDHILAGARRCAYSIHSEKL